MRRTTTMTLSPRTPGVPQRMIIACVQPLSLSVALSAFVPLRSPVQREAAARLAANLAAKSAKRGGLARAVADGLGARPAALFAPQSPRSRCRRAAEPPSTSPLELGSALVAAAWLAGFAVVASLVQRRTRGGDDAS